LALSIAILTIGMIAVVQGDMAPKDQ